LASFSPFFILEAGDYYNRYGYTFQDLKDFMRQFSYNPTVILDDFNAVASTCYDNGCSISGNVIFSKVE